MCYYNNNENQVGLLTMQVRYVTSKRNLAKVIETIEKANENRTGQFN